MGSPGSVSDAFSVSSRLSATSSWKATLRWDMIQPGNGLLTTHHSYWPPLLAHFDRLRPDRLSVGIIAMGTSNELNRSERLPLFQKRPSSFFSPANNRLAFAYLHPLTLTHSINMATVSIGKNAAKMPLVSLPPPSHLPFARRPLFLLGAI
jgi:hypothetical protein